MKRILLILTLLISVSSFLQTKQLKTFDELMNALKTGNNVQTVLHYKYCMVISDNEIQKDTIDAIGGIKIDTWEFFEKGRIRN
ncbi:MAG: hypothetical protein JEZ09_18825 [Salinivirgaceae bacterium]|nr:hypothetical protein [Salinivirgaceae bacterium]